jgi:hypothetical protein
MEGEKLSKEKLMNIENGMKRRKERKKYKQRKSGK